MGSQLPDFTMESEAMLTVGPDVLLDPDPQPETTRLMSRTAEQPLQARRRFRRCFERGAAGQSLDWVST